MTRQAMAEHALEIISIGKFNSMDFVILGDLCRKLELELHQPMSKLIEKLQTIERDSDGTPQAK